MRPLYTRRNLFISFFIIAGVSLLFAFYTYTKITEAIREARKVDISLQSLQVLEDLMDDLQDIETGQRGYVISGNPFFLEPYNMGLNRLGSDTTDVRNLFPLYPGRFVRLENLLSLVRQKATFAAHSIDLLRSGKSDSASLAIRSGMGKQLMDSIRQNILSMENEDRLILQHSNSKRQGAARSSATLLITMTILSFAVLGWLLSKLLKEDRARREHERQIAYLAGLTEQTSDAIFSTDKDWNIQSWNSGAEKLYGYKREEVIGKFAPDITRSGNTREKIAGIAASVTPNRSTTHETVHFDKQGRKISSFVSITGLYNEKEELTGYVMVLRDISERKRNEQLLEEFNAELARKVKEKTTLLENIVGRIRDGFCSVDNDICFTYVNDFAGEVLGRKPADLLGKHLWTEFPEAKESPFFGMVEKVFREQKPSSNDLFYEPYQKWFTVHLYPSSTGLSIFFRDISEIKKAQAELSSSNERFNLISRTTNDAIWEWNLETGEMWGNETHQHLYGRKMTDPVADEKEWENRLHPDDRDNLMKKQEQALASGTNVFITEYRFKTDKEGYRNIYDRCYIVRNKEGKAIRMLGNMMDITERKKAEEALEQSEKKYRAYFENSMDGIMLTSMEGEIFAANPAACTIFGMTEKEICESGRTGLSDLTDPRLGQLLEERRRTGKAKGEVTLIRKNGERFPADVSSAVFPDAAGNMRTSMIIRDITERKKAEQQLRARENHLRTILNTEPECIKLLGPGGELLEMNPAGLSMIEADNLEMVQNKSVLGIILPEYREAFSLLTTSVYQGSSGKLVFEIVGLKGTRRWLETHAVPMRDEEGKIISLLGITRDITQKRSAELAIISSEETRRLIMNSALDAIVCIDKKGIITVWNPQAEKIFGWIEPEALGRSLTETIIPERYKAQHTEGMRRYTETGQGPVLNRLLELIAVSREGNEFPIELSIIPVKQGETEFFCAFIRDITERKQAEQALKESEEKLRQILGSSADDFYVIDRNYRVIMINQTAQKNLEQVFSKKVVTGMYMPDIFPEDRRESIKKNYELVFAGERVEYEFSVNVAGKQQWRRVQYGPVRDESGYINGAFVTTADITERKTAEEDIIKSNARFQVLSRATSDIVWDLDIRSNTLWWNENYYENLGYLKQDGNLDVDEWIRHIHPDDRQRVKQKFEESIGGTDSAWRDEYRYQRSDGSYIDILDRGYIMRDKENNAYRMIGSMVDMTPIYLVQKKVKESENRMRTILDTDPECINLLDRDCTVLDINKAGLAMTETDSAESVIGRSVLIVIDEKQKAGVASLIREAFEGNSGRLEFEMITLKGNRRWCEMNAVPFRDAEKGIISALAVTRDITEKKMAELELARNEEKYRTLVEQASDGIFILSPKGQFLTVNNSCSRISGYSEEEIKQMTIYDLSVRENLENTPPKFDELKKGVTTTTVRQLRKKSGAIIDLEITAKQLTDGNILVFARDISERIKAEKDLQESYKALRELTGHLQNIREEERSNIAREIHDELGQQLTVLKMDISWLNKKLADPGEKIKERMDGLLEMIDNTVRSVRRISSELRPSMLDDLGLPAAIDWHAHEFGKRSGIKIITEIDNVDEKLPGKIAITLFRVFQECLTNVVRHAGASRVNVRLSQQDSRLQLEVKDNGKGFLLKEIENNKTLGILGMRERVSLIQGDYSIDSVPGKGTTVRVSVPVPDEH